MRSLAENTAAAQAEEFPNPPRDCDLCPRLHAFLQKWRLAEPSWYNAPVNPLLPRGGTDSVRLMLAGLAPGLCGANRTGRPFTGDDCGPFLYSTLKKFGFAQGVFAARIDDSLELLEMAIVNAVRCVPPQNKPLGAEINACRRFLQPYLLNLPHLQVVVTLGKVAHDSTLRALGLRVADYPFVHGAEADIELPRRGAAIKPAAGQAELAINAGKADAAAPRKIRLISSYHCSRYNTNTGRLTEAMFHNIFAAARRFLDSGR